MPMMPSRLAADADGSIQVGDQRGSSCPREDGGASLSRRGTARISAMVISAVVLGQNFGCWSGNAARLRGGDVDIRSTPLPKLAINRSLQSGLEKVFVISSVTVGTRTSLSGPRRRFAPVSAACRRDEAGVEQLPHAGLDRVRQASVTTTRAFS